MKRIHKIRREMHSFGYFLYYTFYFYILNVLTQNENKCEKKKNIENRK